MQKVNNVSDAIFWWLEEIPMDELPDEAQTIVGEYRNGTYDVTEASESLEQTCHSHITEWINTNNQLDSIL
jgi:hypothetical protein